jgi:hypothetical protein
VTRHRVATLGRPGPAWPRAVARWGSSATLPLDTTTCVSADELRGLVTHTTIDLAIVEAGLPGVDRVLVDEVRRAGAALAVVDGPALASATARLEPDAVLLADFDPDALAAVLRAHARTRSVPSVPTVTGPEPGAASDPRDLVAVTGPAGGGASTVAQALATHQARLGPVLLADLALDADQHLRHGVRPGHDGVFELADVLRHTPVRAVTAPTVAVAGGYTLLCGLRRRQEWTAVSGSIAEQVVEVLRRSGHRVVADVAPDLDGRAESGSLDLEERNALARAAVAQATTVVVVGRWSTTGVAALIRTLVDLERHGAARDGLLPVLNGAPRSPARRALAARAVLDLLSDVDRGPWLTPRCVGHDRAVERRLREAKPLPRRLVTQVGRLVEAAP